MLHYDSTASAGVVELGFRNQAQSVTQGSADAGIFFRSVQRLQDVLSGSQYPCVWTHSHDVRHQTLGRQGVTGVDEAGHREAGTVSVRHIAFTEHVQFTLDCFVVRLRSHFTVFTALQPVSSGFAEQHAAGRWTFDLHSVVRHAVDVGTAEQVDRVLWGDFAFDQTEVFLDGVDRVQYGFQVSVVDVERLQRTITGEHFRVVVLEGLQHALVVAVVQVGLRIDHTLLQGELDERVTVQVHADLAGAVHTGAFQDRQAVHVRALAFDQLGVSRSGRSGSRGNQTQTEVGTFGTVETGFHVHQRIHGRWLAIPVGHGAGSRRRFLHAVYAVDLLDYEAQTYAFYGFTGFNQRTVGTFEGTVWITLVLGDFVVDHVNPDTQVGSCSTDCLQTTNQSHCTGLHDLLQHGALVAQECRTSVEVIGTVDGAEASSAHQHSGVRGTPRCEQRGPRQKDRQIDDLQRLTLTAHIFKTKNFRSRQRRSHRNRRHVHVSHGKEFQLRA
ncbi:hypothetical protein D3C78_164860 [compost metagenome]